MKRVFLQNYEKIDFKFVQNKEDFIVEEIPLHFSNKGNFLILKIEKQNLSTWDLIEKLASFLKVYSNEIGYAGLKDKNATTIQYISIPKKYSKEIKNFRNKNIKILATYLHSQKLNIGDLKANKFRINLYEVKPKTMGLIEKRVKLISKAGMPNFFGYQRFGKEFEKNQEKAKELVLGDAIIKDKKLEKMLVAAYQSDFFNRWLVNRIKNSKDTFALVEGDLFLDFKKDKFFTPQSINENTIKEFNVLNISPTGLLPGRKVFRSRNKARLIEEKFDDEFITLKGYRRPAFVKVENILSKYLSDKEVCTLEFTLPKGSYATVFIENIANKNFNT